MKIRNLKISNYRNIAFAEQTCLPDFIVLGGGNGCGKSSILEAIYLAKEAAAASNYLSMRNKNVISSGARFASVDMTLELSSIDREFAERISGKFCPEHAEISVKFIRDQDRPVADCNGVVRRLLSDFRLGQGAPGYFDYFSAHRRTQEQKLNSISLAIGSDQAKQSLGEGENKFAITKQYLATLKIQDLQRFQELHINGSPTEGGAYQRFKNFFDNFFSPMKFIDVNIKTDPAQFEVLTPTGIIDIDDLSSGEKEVLHTYLRFHLFEPNGAVVLFDEPDVHLHPEFARRYIDVLKQLAENNQFWLTTHSPEMLLAAPLSGLYTVSKAPLPNKGSQLIRVVDNAERHEILQDVFGATGLLSINQKIIFIEGEHTSSDIEIYEKFYPPTEFGVSFIPAKTSTVVTQIANRVNLLLSESPGFQDYYCIVDGDTEVSNLDMGNCDRLFRLPVYHVENLLIQPKLVYEVTNSLLRTKSPHKSVESVQQKLQELVRSSHHVDALTRAFLNARFRQIAKDAEDAIFAQKTFTIPQTIYSEVQEEVRLSLEESLANGTWIAKCKGRELLKAYCKEHQIKYESFRNLLIDRLSEPPSQLTAIMDKINPLVKKLSISKESIPLKTGIQPSILSNAIVNVEANGESEVIPFALHSMMQPDMKPLARRRVSLNDYAIDLTDVQGKVYGPDKNVQQAVVEALNNLLNTHNGQQLWNSMCAETDEALRLAMEVELTQLLEVPEKKTN